MRSLIFFSLLAFGCGGCASTGVSGDSDVNDPLERANRAIFRFNRKADQFVLRPVASGYHSITPDPLERSISRFFVNLSSPIVIVSDLLQGKLKQAGADTGRFLLNSTVGVLGFLDVATQVGLEYHDEDFGQTLGRWGLEQGPYFIVPIFGPYTLRDGFGRVLELPFELINHIDNKSYATRPCSHVLYRQACAPSWSAMTRWPTPSIPIFFCVTPISNGAAIWSTMETRLLWRKILKTFIRKRIFLLMTS